MRVNPIKTLQPHAWAMVAASLWLAGTAFAQDVIVVPADLKWTQEASRQSHVLHADAAHGVRTVRMRIPPNQTLPPHGAEKGYFIATVISGTLELGIGKEWDEAALKTLPPGSIFTHPTGSQQHFARTGEEAVILQVTAVSAPPQ